MATFAKPRTLQFSYSKEPQDTNCASQRAQPVWAQGHVSQQGLATLLWHESSPAEPLKLSPIQQSWLLWSPCYPRAPKAMWLCSTGHATELSQVCWQLKGKRLATSVLREWDRIERTDFQSSVFFLQLVGVFLGLLTIRGAWFFSPSQGQQNCITITTVSRTIFSRYCNL